MQIKSAQQKNTLILLGLIAVTLVVYLPALTCGFVNTDDPLYITNNYHINGGWSWVGFKWCFQAGYSANWHPITWMSHMMDCQIFQLKPAGHHAVNVLLHVFNTGLLFLMMMRLTGARWRSAAVAALFAWHPLHVESVAWISERKDVLCGFFFLLSLWSYVRFTGNNPSQNDDTKPKCARLWYWPALVFFALALMAKPMAVTLPCVLLLLDFWPLGKNTAFKQLPWKKLILEKIPFFSLSVAASILTVVAQNRGGAIVALARTSLLARLINADLSYYRYAKNMFWPTSLAVKYPYDLSINAGELLVATAFVVAGTVLAVQYRKSRPYWLTGWLWYLGMLVPVIGLLQVGGQAMADRFTYLPMIGLFIILAWELCDFVTEQPRWRTGAITAAAAILVACCVLTCQQVGVWQNGGTLFAHAIKVTKNNYGAHASYASWLRNNNRLEEARMQCVAALTIAPNYAPARGFLGNIFLAQNKLDAAEEQLRATIELEPATFTAHADLGRVLLAKDHPKEAAAQFAIALQQGFNIPAVHDLLGQSLFRLGKLNEASEEYAQALRLDPGDPELHGRLGQALAAQHQWPAAIQEYRTAVKLQSNDPALLNNLAWALATNPQAELRNGAEAVQLATQACTLTQNKDPRMIGTLAAAFAEAARFPEAIAASQKAHDTALTNGEKELAARNLEMLKSFRTGKPYHE